MPDEVLDGFDHTQYRDEVIARWGKDDHERADRWWRSLGDAEKQRFLQTQVQIAKDYATALLDGKPADSDEAQATTKRHVEWLSATKAPSKGYLLGLESSTSPTPGSPRTTSGMPPARPCTSATRWRSTPSVSSELRE